jgi:hypothetical protein
VFWNNLEHTKTFDAESTDSSSQSTREQTAPSSAAQRSSVEVEGEIKEEETQQLLLLSVSAWVEIEGPCRVYAKYEFDKLSSSTFHSGRSKRKR